ncbi:MAG TPA: hypothetical protein VFU15_10165 [Bacteroidia bacterium]|nr:hypothetical protein [Bacteroidia bacterium]
MKQLFLCLLFFTAIRMNAQGDTLHAQCRIFMIRTQQVPQKNDSGKADTFREKPYAVCRLSDSVFVIGNDTFDRVPPAKPLPVYFTMRDSAFLLMSVSRKTVPFTIAAVSVDVMVNGVFVENMLDGDSVKPATKQLIDGVAPGGTIFLDAFRITDPSGKTVKVQHDPLALKKR